MKPSGRASTRLYCVARCEDTIPEDLRAAGAALAARAVRGCGLSRGDVQRETHHQLGTLAQVQRNHREAKKWYNKVLGYCDKQDDKHLAAGTYNLSDSGAARHL